MSATDPRRPLAKSPWLVTLPLLFVASVSGLIVIPWARRLDMNDASLAAAAAISASIWVVLLWWSFHHLLFQLAAFFKTTSARLAHDTSPTPVIHFAVLYLACDDFQPECCRSALEQAYPANAHHVFICDDSADPRPVDAFARAHPEVTVVRRGNRLGYKAGNLNYAFSHEIDEAVGWIVIADADQVLPPGYLGQMARAIASLPHPVAFVQGAHDSTGASAISFTTTAFQEALKYDIKLFYQRDLAWRERSGFLPFLGHGAAVSAAAWRTVGGFPKVVSEDYAFALRVSAEGLGAHYADDVLSYEAFPKDFAAFLVRLKKFAGGSAQLMRREARAFQLSRASRVEKLDAAMLFLWYPLMPAMILNGFLSAYVCARLWERGVGALHPALPYVFLGMFLLVGPVVRSVTESYGASVRYWIWSTAVYTAALPMASWFFLRGLVKEPRFEPTPKGNAPAAHFRAAGFITVLLGLLCIERGLRAWLSPFSPVLVGYGLAYVSFPFYFHLHKPGLPGTLARMTLFLPGAAFVVALAAMWWWGRL